MLFYKLTYLDFDKVEGLKLSLVTKWKNQISELDRSEWYILAADPHSLQYFYDYNKVGGILGARSF